jgi:aryl-alcohol dehydrogenase-like predicted oxidoreductase
VDRRRLGTTGIELSPVGFGAFKIGRNEGIKYPAGYALPTDDEVAALVDGLLDMGINYFDTAPAYGTSEERLGRVLGTRSRDVVISTKVGETFEDGRSSYDFSADGIRESVGRSLRRLGRDVLDLVFIHSDGRDLEILNDTVAVPTLEALRDEGLVRAIGLSGKTVEGARAALAWADAIMIEYHLQDRSHEPVLGEAAAAGVGVVVKKPLASGHLDPAAAIRFAVADPAVASVVVGTLSLDHMRANLEAASS